jgi:hypothetical protein
LSGKGDTPSRVGLSNRESVALDWKEISKSINRQFGKRTILIMGLCSGADNAIKLTGDSPSVRGLILLDPVAKRDRDFQKRKILTRIKNIHYLANLPVSIFKRVKRLICLKKGNKSLSSLRDQPNESDILNCFTAIKDRDGRVIAFFTGAMTDVYNLEGQFAKTLPVNIESLIVEKFWPDAEHVYPVQFHRDRLLNEIESWAVSHFSHFKESSR